jgi:hypothetical protein
MSFFRIKTVKTKSGKTLSYLYRQTSVRDGQKVRSIMEYFGSFNGKDIQESTKNRNSDLEATRNPKRADYTNKHRKGLFKTDKAAFERLQAFDAARAQGAKESKAAWKEKNMSRADKQAGAHAKEAADAKWKDTKEAVEEFKQRMEARAEADTTVPDGTAGTKSQ